MNMSYDEVRRIYRLEKSTSSLVEVESDFYNSLHDFVQTEKEKYLKSLKSFSMEEMHDFANLKKMVETIFLYRQKKVLSLAIAASRGAETSDDKMARPEQALFSECVRLLSEQSALMTQMFGSGEKKDSQASPALGLNTLLITIVKEVPAFIGADMKEYGPFEKNQSVSLPNKVARLLIERRLAQEADA